MEMEKSLSGNKTMKKLTLSDDRGVTLPKQFCLHLLLGIRRNKSLFKVYLRFSPQFWYFPDDGKLHMWDMSINKQYGFRATDFDLLSSLPLLCQIGPKLCKRGINLNPILVLQMCSYKL